MLVHAHGPDSTTTMTECVVTGNTATVAAAVADYNRTLHSVDSDWGVGAADNDPADLLVAAPSASSYETMNFGDGATFTCEMGVCQ